MDLIAHMNQAIDGKDYPLAASFTPDEGTVDSGFGPPSIGGAGTADRFARW
jgi:hypothetical protein